jgi:hypothetical protein
MSNLNLSLSSSIHRHVDEMAQKEGISVEQFIASAIAEKISAIATEDYLRERATRARREGFQSILERSNEREPWPGDGLHEQDSRDSRDS